MMKPMLAGQVLRQALVAIGLAVGGTACGGAVPVARQPEMTPTLVTTNAAPNDEALMPTNGADGTVATPGKLLGSPRPTQIYPAGTALTDAQVAAITDAANTGELEQARLVVGRAKHQRVKDFAQLMIDHHGAAKLGQQMLVSSLGIGSTPSDTSAHVASEAQAGLASLSEAVGDDFDKAYVDLQIREHKEALDLFDTKLIPSTHAAQFKSALVDFRAKIADHLQRAQDLQQILAKE